MKRAFLYPGQGSQYVGMGRDLAAAFPQAREAFSTAEAVLGFPLSQLCFSGPEEDLKKTANTQPALLAHSTAVTRVLAARGIVPEAVAGHSLGAYSALVAAGVLAYEDALRLVRRRGELMEEVGAGRGTMAAVLGLEDAQVQEACRQASSAGVVEPANVNCPGQVVISGVKEAVVLACEKAKALGAKRTIELAVSGPFHCSLMAPAAEAFRDFLKGVVFSAPRIPYYSDIEACRLEDPSAIRESLVNQLVKPVLWTGVITRLVADGYDRFVEAGPGGVLAGLVGKIDRTRTVASVGDPDAVNKMEVSS